MRPKPTREWVMNELERLNVRVVSGRPSKELNGSDEDGTDNGAGGASMGTSGGGAVSATNTNNAAAAANGAADLQGNPSITASLLNVAELARGLGIDANTLLNQQRRNSSLAMSLLEKEGRDSNITAAAVAAMGNGMNKNDTGPHHRPLVGGGSAAAYEAARADYYRNLAEKKGSNSRDTLDISDSGRGSLSGSSLPGNSRRLSSLGGLFNESSSGQLGDAFNAQNGNSNNTGGNSGGGSFGLSVNPNAHYEMLKLHHMNLLNEIQETTLMMNLYQQQQLQQRQQQKKLEQEQQFLAQQQQLLGRSNSIGLSNFNAQTMNNNNSIPQSTTNTGPTALPAPSPAAIPNPSFPSKNDAVETPQETPPTKQQEESAATAELNEHEKQLQKIKEEIEARKRQLEELEKAAKAAPAASSKEVTEANQDGKSLNENGKSEGAALSKDGGESNEDGSQDTGHLEDCAEPPIKKPKVAKI